MHELIMLVGLPGCGKTTWAKNYQKDKDVAIFSSDDIREELKLGYTPQDHEKVFSTLNKRLKECLKNKDCIYDATNLNYKHRMNFLKQLDVDVKKTCYVFACPVASCKRRNKQRDAVVPEEAYPRMLKSFYVPAYFEGWDEINVVSFPEDDVDRHLDLSMADTFDQKNPHHSLTLGQHMMMTAKSVGEQSLLYNAAYWHDIGKLYTQTIVDGVAHYYNHENVGAYVYLSYLSPNYYGLHTAFLINWHMRPFVWDKSERCKNREHEMLGDNRFEELMIIHEADRGAK